MPGRTSLISRRSLRTAPALACLLVGGCGFAAVTVKDYAPQPGTAATCRTLVRNLPDTVDDAIRRDLDPPVATAAAWGAPPVVLRCGVTRPPEYRPDAQLFEVDGVSWLPVKGEGGYFFTTIGRRAHIEVAVPDRYAPEAQVLTDLAPAIKAHVPLSADRGDAAAPS